MRALIICLKLGIPLISISYDIKVNSLFESFDIQEYCIKYSDFSSEKLIEIFKNLDVQNYDFALKRNLMDLKHYQTLDNKIILN